jgi:hypothetical protein
MTRVFPSRLFRSLACAAILSFLSSSALHAQTKIEGQVLNGTTNNPVADQQVSLLVPRQGMQKVATATTDSSGRFAFDQSDIDPKGFYLVEAVFRGVPYHAPVLFKSAPPVAVTLQVYEPTSAASILRVQLLLIGVRAVGNKVDVREMFTIENSSQPPLAYVDPKGTFRFHVSPDVGQPDVAVKGLLDMQLPQNVQRGKLPGDYAIHYPLKPGRNVITISYETDYSAAKFHLDDRVPYAIDRAELLVMPANLTVESEGFKSAGGDATSNIKRLTAENLPRQAALEADLSGQGLPESSAGNESSGQGAQSGEEPQVKIVPASITKLALPLLGCFLLVFIWALGVRIAREWPRLKQKREAEVAKPGAKKIGAKADKLLNSLADLDELFAGGKIAEKDYWKERLELKARVVAALKKTSSPPVESYAGRRSPR